MIRRPPRSTRTDTLFPYTTLSRSVDAAVALSRHEQIPLVATNDVRFLAQDDFETHEARVCIAQGRVLNDPKRPRDYSDQQYLKSSEEMAELFADLPEALANSVEIDRRCSLTLKFAPQIGSASCRERVCK